MCEISSALASVESAQCLDNFIIKELQALGEDGFVLSKVKEFLNGKLSGKIVFWEEDEEEFLETKMAITEARKTIAMCIGADPAEIYFTSCGTESDNWVIKMGSQGVEQVVTTVIEHHAVLNSCFCIEWI